MVAFDPVPCRMAAIGRKLFENSRMPSADDMWHAGDAIAGVGLSAKMNQARTFSGEGEQSTLTPGSAPQSAVLVQVHLWIIGSSATSEAAVVPPPALAMAADLLQVRGGELRDSTASSIAATFADPVLAVNAARNLQRLVEGFAREWQGGALGGCTTLTCVEEARDGIDVGSLRDNQALKQTHPGQVIFLGSLCEAARSIPGLEFRSIAGVTPGRAGNGAARQALQLLPPLRMEGYVEVPFEPKVIVQEAPVAAPEPLPSPAQPVVTPRPPAYVLVSSPPSGKSSAVVAAATPPSSASGTVRAVPPAPTAVHEIGSFSREEKTSGSGIPRWAMIGGVAAALVVGALIFALRRTPHPAPVPAQQQAEPAATAPAPAVGDAVPAGSEAPTAPSPVVSTKTKASDAPHGKAAPHAATALTEPPAAEPAPAEETHNGRGLTFTPAEISSLIAHADRDSGNGNFDKAIQEYRLVLSREPSNDLAKRGLARALYNKEHQ